MREPTLAELDMMVRDFLGQLLDAKTAGWDKSRPEHYRALLASLRMALSHRQARRAAISSANGSVSPAKSPAAFFGMRPMPSTLAAKAIPDAGMA